MMRAKVQETHRSDGMTRWGVLVAAGKKILVAAMVLPAVRGKGARARRGLGGFACTVWRERGMTLEVSGIHALGQHLHELSLAEERGSIQEFPSGQARE